MTSYDPPSYDPTDPYLYGRRPTDKAYRLRKASHEVMLAHAAAGDIPTNIRFVYYELEQAGVVDKTKTRAKGRGSDQGVTDALTWLRDEGLVPWPWIVDETRELTTWAYAATVADYLRDRVGEARLDCWGPANQRRCCCAKRARSAAS